MSRSTIGSQYISLNFFGHPKFTVKPTCYVSGNCEVTMQVEHYMRETKM